MVDPMKDKEKMERTKNDLKDLTGGFCRSKINEEYAALCEKMIDKMARKRNVPFLSGRRETWAASIVYSLGQINFLFDSTFEPYIDGADICDYFNVSRSSVSSKAKKIREMFRMGYYDEEFSSERNTEKNPMRDFVMLNNGLIVTKDYLRDMILGRIIVQPDEEEDPGVETPDEMIHDERKDTIHEKEEADQEKRRDKNVLLKGADEVETCSTNPGYI
jgi:hypothetical protein